MTFWVLYVGIVVRDTVVVLVEVLVVGLSLRQAWDVEENFAVIDC